MVEGEKGIGERGRGGDERERERSMWGRRKGVGISLLAVLNYCMKC